MSIESKQREHEARANGEASAELERLTLQRALEAASVGTFVWHTAPDRLEPDARTRALFGLTDEAAPAAAFRAAIHEDDRARHAAAIAAALELGGPGLLREDIRVVAADGSLRWISLTAQAAFEPGAARATRLVGLVMDVSERKAIEAQLREREEALKEGDRRKDEFLAMLAHELRNPLAPIRTGLELIRVAGDTPEAIARVRTMMERQVFHMVRLIDDLLDVSRITSGKIRLQRQPTALKGMISTAIEANRAAIDAAGVALGIDLPEPSLTLDVDPTRLVQVLSNLLHNAVKFTPTTGTIRIAVAREPAGGLQITITDSGIGMSRDTLIKVFELFTQGDPAAPQQDGLGIGLALAQRLIELHGGSIEAASGGVGYGSTFTIRFPESVIVEAVAEAADAGVSAKLSRRIAVIDDNADSAELMAMYVSELGCVSEIAYDGESGLELVQRFQPEVVLLDIGMPGMDGYETCRRIRQTMGARVLVVAMTGWGQERDKQQAKEAGFDAHLTKPVDPAALNGLLANVSRGAPRSSTEVGR